MARAWNKWMTGLVCLASVLLIDSSMDLARRGSSSVTAADEQPIDFNKARELFQRRQRGEKLSADETKYLERAIAERRRADEKQRGSMQRRTGNGGPSETVGFKPLTEMTADDRYEGQDGGLYGGGKNVPPEPHRRAAEAELARIQRLSANGQPDPNGRVVFVSISMSNATQEFSRFKKFADAAESKSPALTIVDCAQGGQAMAEWVSPNANAWRETDRRLQVANVSAQQVQVAWIKLANKGPSGSLEEHGRKLQQDTQAVVRNAKARFPNLRIAYLSSRIYGGYAAGALNPEPYAYESAFAARWLIQDQIAGKAELNFDTKRGDVKAPLLLWGPYLWADGTTPRRADKLSYKLDDFARDGTHPSDAGQNKVAGVMLEFFRKDPLASSWFVRR